MPTTLLLLDSTSLRCDHLGSFCCPFVARFVARLTKKIPSRRHADHWVLDLRDQFRISVGSAYRVSVRRGKTKLDVRFQNGTRQYPTLDRAWLPANSIRTKKIDILFELIKKKKGLKICEEQNV